MSGMSRSPTRPSCSSPVLPRRAALLALLILVPTVAGALELGPYELRAITGDDSAATRQVVEALSRKYPGLQVGSEPKVLLSRKRPGISLAIGPAALQAALAAELNGPVVSLFTSSQVFAAAMAGAPRSRSPVTAIYAEASPAQQMQLIARLYARRVTVGVLITDNTAHLQPLLQQAARSENLDLHLERVGPGENVLRALTRLNSANVLLAVPDSGLYTPANLRNLLESTYRRNQSVVGFSTALVNAGTLAAAYSSIDDTIAHLDELIPAIVSGRVPEPQFPRYWRVAVNDSVARSLNLVVDEAVRSLGNRAPARSQ